MRPYRLLRTHRLSLFTQGSGGTRMADALDSPMAERDDADAHAPPSKRPRVGRPHASILGPVEASTSTSGRMRHLFAVLLHAGKTSRDDASFADVLFTQARDVASSYTTDPSAVVHVIFERCVHCSSAVLAHCAPCTPSLHTRTGARLPMTSTRTRVAA